MPGSSAVTVISRSFSLTLIRGARTAWPLARPEARRARHTVEQLLDLGERVEGPGADAGRYQSALCQMLLAGQPGPG
jgi:hypothetical protein